RIGSCGAAYDHSCLRSRSSRRLSDSLCAGDPRPHDYLSGEREVRQPPPQRAVLLASPGATATARSPTPSNQPSRTSRTSTIPAPLITTAVDLHVYEHDGRIKQASRGLNPHDASGGSN